MATLKDIKLRMGSVKNTQQITKAMKLVAASKMKRAEDKIRAARPYTDKLTLMVSNLAEGINPDAHPLLSNQPGGKTVVLLFTSDKGLCGALNNNLCKKVFRANKNLFADPTEIEIIDLGRKGADFFKRTDRKVSEVHKDLKEAEYEVVLSKVISKLAQRYSDGEFNKLYMAYNHFVNVITQEQRVQQILPVQTPARTPSLDHNEFLLEPDPASILSAILPQYIENQAYAALLDGFACEHAARMTAMDAATTNAGELLKGLQLQYNRARQAAITTELTEIISGAESL